MRITFFLSVYEIFFQRISEVLRESLSDPIYQGIAYGRLGPIRLRNTGTAWGEIAIFTDYLRHHGLDRPFDLTFLEDKEKEIGIPNLTPYITSDRYISKLKYEKAMRALELCIRFVEEALDRQNPDLIIMDDVCCMLSYLIYKIGKKRGLPVWSLGSIKLNHRVSIYDDCLDSREKVNRIYRELLTRDLTEEERQRAESFYNDYVTRYEPLLYLKTRSKVPDLSIPAFWKWIRMSIEHLRDPLDVTRMDFWEMARARITRVIRYHLGNALQLFEDPVPGERYVFYPIQVQPERSTLILAPFLCDQLALIENISKSLPIGYRLYVKEHPIFLGRRPLREFRKIQSFHNVRLIKTQLPSVEIVKNAALVISISNTVGMEAILFERPLIVLGDAFYKEYTGAVSVENVRDLPYKIQETLEQFKPDRDNLLKFILALVDGSYPGTRRQPRAVPYTLTWENVREVSEALLAEMKAYFGSTISVGSKTS